MSTVESAARHCSCGGSIRVSSFSAQAVQDVTAMFDQMHSGDGHTPASARQAARARATTDDEPTPPPGSPAARALGCRCPVLDNEHGRGRGGDGARFGWYIVEGCPVHPMTTGGTS